MASECRPDSGPLGESVGCPSGPSGASHHQQHHLYYDPISRALSLGISARKCLLALVDAPSVSRCVGRINALLTWANVPEKSLLTNEEFVLSSTAVVATLVGYYVLFGKRHRRKRKRLAEELRVAQRQVHFLEENLMLAKREDILASTPTRPSRARSVPGVIGVNSLTSEPRQIRIFMDGAFDIMHYGHMNAFRLGRSLGTYLIVGVNSDESIRRCKGPPLMNDNERLTMVEGCKFVDAVVPDCPYVMTSEYLDHIFEAHDVDYVVHGDDPCIVDGKDVYESAKRRGRYRSIPRTEGVSTTDIVGRMLLMTKDHHLRPVGRRKRGMSEGSLSLNVSVSKDEGSSDSDNEIFDEGDGEGEDDVSVLTAANYNESLREDPGGDAVVGVLGHRSKFLTTSAMLRQFSAGVKHPEEGVRVVYVDGAWDMFHCGHVEFLREASKRGDYLIVGVHGDSAVNRRREGNLPLMNLHERVLSVLGCKYASDVLIDAPVEVTPDMIASLKITEVVHGTEHDGDGGGDESFGDRYGHPMRIGIFVTIESPSSFKLQNILSRIQRKHSELQSKIDRKKRAEREWFDGKYQNGGRQVDSGNVNR